MNTRHNVDKYGVCRSYFLQAERHDGSEGGDVSMDVRKGLRVPGEIHVWRPEIAPHPTLAPNLAPSNPRAPPKKTIVGALP